MGVSHAKCRHFWQTANAFFMWHLQKSKTNFHPSVGLSAACLISSHCIAFWSFFTFLIFFLAIPHLLPSWEILASICPKNSLDIFSRFECFINKSSLSHSASAEWRGEKNFCVFTLRIAVIRASSFAFLASRTKRTKREELKWRLLRGFKIEWLLN